MPRRPIARENQASIDRQTLDGVAASYGVRRERAAVHVAHVKLEDRPLINISSEHPFWTRIDPTSGFQPDELNGAIVWLKPPSENLRLQDAVEWLKRQGALVRLLPADRVNTAPRASGSEARVQELQISDARECCAVLVKELAAREGVDVAAVMDAVEQSLSAAGI